MSSSFQLSKPLPLLYFPPVCPSVFVWSDGRDMAKDQLCTKRKQTHKHAQPFSLIISRTCWSWPIREYTPKLQSCPCNLQSCNMCHVTNITVKLFFFFKTCFSTSLRQPHLVLFPFTLWQLKKKKIFLLSIPVFDLFLFLSFVFHIYLLHSLFLSVCRNSRYCIWCE